MTFEQAWARVPEDALPAVLLGNGYSRAWNNEIFDYASLLEVADFGERSEPIRALFARLSTYDFEAVMRALSHSALVLETYGGDAQLLKDVRGDQEVLKSALLQAISDSHPELPWEVSNEGYQRTRAFLMRFGRIFSVNYDLLMYWARNMSDMEPHWDSDDGFRALQRWQGFGTRQNVYFLHGGLHIFDSPQGVRKHAYRDAGSSIIEQVRKNLQVDKFPLFVAEPTHEQKRQRIEANPYLYFCYRALSEIENVLFVLGHSMDENDAHIFNRVRRSEVKEIFVGIFGDPESDANRRSMANAGAFLAGAGRQVNFFDAATAPLW